MTEETAELKEAFKQCFLRYQQLCVVYNDLKREFDRYRMNGYSNDAKVFITTVVKGTKDMEDRIRERAYLKWEAAGYPQGDGVNFWLQAEEELKSDAPRTSNKKSAEPKRVAAKATVAKKR